MFSVKDSGIGIAAGDLDRIFEEYGQIENPLQKRVKGIGLGLPLTQEIGPTAGRERFGRQRAGRGFDVFRRHSARV